MLAGTVKLTRSPETWFEKIERPFKRRVNG